MIGFLLLAALAWALTSTITALITPNDTHNESDRGDTDRERA